LQCNNEFSTGCSCAPGFTGVGCKTVIVAPGISNCFSTMSAGGSSVGHDTSFCLEAFDQLSIYTNVHDLLKVQFSANNNPHQAQFTASAYPINTQSMPNTNQKFGSLVTEFQFGIADYQATVRTKRGTEVWTIRKRLGPTSMSWSCSTGSPTVGQAAPSVSSLSCSALETVGGTIPISSEGISLTSLGLQDGDQVRTEATVCSAQLV